MRSIAAPVNVKKAAEVSGFCGEMRENCGRTVSQKILNFNSDIVKRYFQIIFVAQIQQTF
jgi:hypothetical protein